MKKTVLFAIIAVVLLAVLGGGYYYLKAPSKAVTIDDEKYAQYSNSKALISPAALKELMEKKNVVIVDFRSPAKYTLEHIPGAVNAWREEQEDTTHQYGGMRANPEQFKNFLEGKGISNNSTVIIYDETGGMDAARMWWILALYGHDLDKVRLLDGGLPAWKGSGFETTMAQPTIERGEYKMDEKNFRMELLAEVDEVLAELNNPEVVILDTRAESEWNGTEQKKGAIRKGRIPGAPLLEWKDSVKEDWTFKSAEDLRAMFASKGVTTDKAKILAYCQSAVRSAHTTFVLTQLLGFTNVKNYDGSWIEWSARQDLPIEAGENQ